MNGKELAGKKATEFIKDGMIVGLGTGSTAECFIHALAEKNLDIKCVCTSKKTDELAKQLGLQVIDFETEPDITVDGADEIDQNHYLIKGGGGALTREKIIDYNSKKLIIIADSSKLVEKLGKFRLPIEVIPMSYKIIQKQLIEKYNATSQKRDFVTDNGNFILDCDFGFIENPKKLEQELNQIPGVVENGLFTKPVTVIVGDKVL